MTSNFSILRCNIVGNTSLKQTCFTVKYIQPCVIVFSISQRESKIPSITPVQFL